MTDPQKLRALANFLESNKGLSYSVSSLVLASGKDEMLRVARLPGAKKLYDDSYLYVEVPIAEFGLTYFISRESVCTPVKTEDEFVPAREAYIRKKVTEWECHPLLKPADFEEASSDLVF